MKVTAGTPHNDPICKYYLNLIMRPHDLWVDEQLMKPNSANGKQITVHEARIFLALDHYANDNAMAEERNRQVITLSALWSQRLQNPGFFTSPFEIDVVYQGTKRNYRSMIPLAIGGDARKVLSREKALQSFAHGYANYLPIRNEELEEQASVEGIAYQIHNAMWKRLTNL